MADFQAVINRYEIAENAYLSKWAKSIGSAYAEAHKGATATVKAQNDLERARLDMFLTVVSFGIGSGIGGLFAKKSAKSMAVDFVANREMVRTFEVMARIEASKELSFYVQKSWAKANSVLAAQTIAAVKKLGQRDISLKTIMQTPLVFQNKLEQYVLDAIAAGQMIAEDYRTSSTISDAEKEAKAAEMLASPVLKNAPTNPVFPDAVKGGGIIELSWYMAEIMASDRYIKRHISANSVTASARTLSNESIDVRTTDPKYPTRQDNVKTSGFLWPSRAEGTRSTIEYNQMGSKLVDRTNKLYGDYKGDTKAKFFNRGLDGDEVARAETLYDQLTAKVGRRF